MNTFVEFYLPPKMAFELLQSLLPILYHCLLFVYHFISSIHIAYLNICDAQRS